MVYTIYAELLKTFHKSFKGRFCSEKNVEPLNCIYTLSALAIRKKVQQQVFAGDICQFEGISTAKI